MNVSVIQSMINSIDKPAIFIDTNYVINAVNQAYIDTYEAPIKTGVSRCYEISHGNHSPCDNHGEACPLQECLSTGKTASVVHIHKTSRGRKYCDIVMRPVKGDDGSIIGYLEILDRIDFATVEGEANKMIGQSTSFKTMLSHINRVAQTDVSVLLQGDTGTGKELVARALHSQSKRNDKPFVVIECTGLSESLFESELFGYEKGAFTGASVAKKGLVEVAQGGTIFFDEIGDVPMNMQVKLLRLIETHSFRAVGGLKQKRADFRLVCASHKDLLKMVDEGTFRKDLYYRIATYPVFLPSLEERRSDIPLLAKHFLKQSEFSSKHFSDAALNRLAQLDFPGNIRELKSVIIQSAILANDELIDVDDIPYRLQPTASKKGQLLTLVEQEQQYLENLCQTFTGSVEQMADVLGVSQRTLYRKLKQFNLKPLNPSKSSD